MLEKKICKPNSLTLGIPYRMLYWFLYGCQYLHLVKLTLFNGTALFRERNMNLVSMSNQGDTKRSEFVFCPDYINR